MTHVSIERAIDLHGSLYLALLDRGVSAHRALNLADNCLPALVEIAAKSDSLLAHDELASLLAASGCDVATAKTPTLH
jgi:hypothetical protein